MTQRRHKRRRATCHPDRPYYISGRCRSCHDALERLLDGATPADRTRCPGCGRDDVILLPPTTGAGHRPPHPWRRKAHAVRGDLGQPGTMRCRYPLDLNAQPTEHPE